MRKSFAFLATSGIERYNSPESFESAKERMSVGASFVRYFLLNACIFLDDTKATDSSYFFPKTFSFIRKNGTRGTRCRVVYAIANPISVVLRAFVRAVLRDPSAPFLQSLIVFQLCGERIPGACRGIVREVCSGYLSLCGRCRRRGRALKTGAPSS